MARVSVGDKVSSLVALAVLVVGLGIAGVGAYDYVGQSTAVENAVTVEATVTETEVTEVSKRRGGTEYDPDVRFRYTYEGERYVSENLFPATVTPDYGTREEAESVLEGYGTEATWGVRQPRVAGGGVPQERDDEDAAYGSRHGIVHGSIRRYILR